jgi:hypothetical protein
MEEDHGKRAEDAVENICHRLFGPELVLRSPKLMEKSGPKELADVLVMIEDTLVVIQSKSKLIDVTDLDPTKFGRIEKMHEKAKRQLNTTLNAHRRGARVLATTSLGVTFDLDWSWIKQRIGIVTLHVSDEAYQDPEFRFQYPYAVQEHKGIIVHTFLLNDLNQMASELTTPADVLRYMSTRHLCLASGRYAIPNELDFLAHFKMKYAEIQRSLSNPAYDLEVLSPGTWEFYRKTYAQQLRERDDRLKNSTLVDRIIRQLRPCPERCTGQNGTPQHVTASNYLRLMGKFAKLARVERAAFGDELARKVEKTKRVKSGYFLRVSRSADTAYLFLLDNEPDREMRIQFLGFLAVQACHQVECSQLVGVAISGPQLPKFSSDAILMDVGKVKATTKPDTESAWFAEGVHQKIGEWKS